MQETGFSPHGRAFYSARAIFALLAGTVFIWGVFLSGSFPFLSRIFGVLLVVLFYLVSWQSFERLLRPKKAFERTGALSGNAHNRLRFVTKVMTIAFTTGLVISSAMRLIDHQRLRDVAGDIWIFGAALLVAAAFLADLNGERVFYPYRPK